MNKFVTALCIIGTAFVLSACGTSQSYNSGANYASDTAGDMAGTQAQTERVFRKAHTK